MVQAAGTNKKKVRTHFAMLTIHRSMIIFLLLFIVHYLKLFIIIKLFFIILYLIGTGQRGSGKGRGSVSTLPYVIPCTTTDTGQTSDSSDGNIEEKKGGEGGKVYIFFS